MTGFELKRVVRTMAVALMMVTAFAAAAKASQEIGWDDLVGQVEPFEDPFLALNPDQLADLSVIARMRQRRDKDDSLSGDTLAALQEKENRLKSQGIDVDHLIAQREFIKERRTAAAESMNNALDGRRIRMPGYLLPLEFDGDRATEFLLVPFVGACIHVPPPPPNQIVSVTYPAGYKNKLLFAPVWVEGEIRVGATQENLFLTDGSADIDVGYALKAIQVKPYSE